MPEPRKDEEKTSFEYFAGYNGLVSRPWPTKLSFAVTLVSLSLTLFALGRIFRASLNRAHPAEAAQQSVFWQRWRMIGQAGVIAGLAAPIVVEGLGWDVPSKVYAVHDARHSLLLRCFGLLGRKEAQVS